MSKESKEISVTQKAELAAMGADWGQEEINANEIGISHLVLVQGNNPLIKDKKAGYGDIFETGSEKIVGQDLEFIYCGKMVYWQRFNKDGAKMIKTKDEAGNLVTATHKEMRQHFPDLKPTKLTYHESGDVTWKYMTRLVIHPMFALNEGDMTPRIMTLPPSNSDATKKLTRFIMDCANNKNFPCYKVLKFKPEEVSYDGNDFLVFNLEVTETKVPVEHMLLAGKSRKIIDTINIQNDATDGMEDTGYGENI